MQIVSTSVCFLMAISLLIMAYSHHRDTADNDKFERAYLQEKFGTLWISSDSTSFHQQNGFPPLLEDQAYLGGAMNDSTYASNLLQSSFNGRKANYEKSAGNLRIISEILLVLSVIALLILFFRPKELSMPIIHVKIPDVLLYLFVPAGICYFWYQFSLTFNAAHDSRLVLELMTDHQETFGNQRLHYYYSNARNLVDQGIIDTWCTYYYDIFEGGVNGASHQGYGRGVLFSIYGVFWGLMHAVTFILLFYFYELKKKVKLIWLLWWTVTSTLIIATYGFIEWYPHSALLFSSVWAIALTSIFFWSYFGLRKADELEAKQGPQPAPVKLYRRRSFRLRKGER